jgi:hypothetical protein
MKDDFEKKYFAGGKSKYGPKYLRKVAFSEARRRLAMLSKHVTNPQNKRILDVGCAMGHFLKLCENTGFETYGIDVSSYAVQKAKELTKNSIIYIRTLKEGGIICLTTPNPIGVKRILSKFVGPWKDKDVTHININSPQIWIRLLEIAGFRVIATNFLIENLCGKFDLPLPYLGGTTVIFAQKSLYAVLHG